MNWRALLQRHWWRKRPTVLARALQPLSWVYAALLTLRQRLTGKAVPLTVPVIVVGNCIVGGAGKTPTVIALTQALQALGWRPGIVSRGYGRSSQGVVEVSKGRGAADVGDEPLLIWRRCAVPVVVGEQRRAAAQALLANHPEVDILISDDGLQHVALPRDLTLIVFDERGRGNGLCLPAGPLRAPWPTRVPVVTLVLYNASAASTPWPGVCLPRRLRGVTPLGDWWQGSSSALPLETLAGRPCLAAAGIAAPERFFAMLEDAGLQVERLPLDDHHDFSELPWPAGAVDVIVTEKDAVKLDPNRVVGTTVWVATLDFSLPADLVDALTYALPRHDA